MQKRVISLTIAFIICKSSFAQTHMDINIDSTVPNARGLTFLTNTTFSFFLMN